MARNPADITATPMASDTEKSGTTWKAAPMPLPIATIVAPTAISNTPTARGRSDGVLRICHADHTRPNSNRKYAGME